MKILRDIYNNISFPAFDLNTKLEFIKEYNQKAIPYFRASILLIFIVSIPYIFLDILAIPLNIEFAWIVRLGIWLPILLAAFVLSYFPFAIRYFQFMGSVVSLTIGFGVLAMIAVSQRAEMAYTMYYSGIGTAIVLIIIMRMRFVLSFVISSILVVSYILLAIIQQDILLVDNKVNYPVIFLNNLFFLISTAIVSWVASYILESYARNNFLHQQFTLKEKYKIELQKNKIQSSHKDVTANIRYASRIQENLLPNSDILLSYFSEYFILNKPKDIVSGDFYWIKKQENYLIFAVADCTGHGVSAAFMSILGISFLNEICAPKKTPVANEILFELREKVINSVSRIGQTNETNDGMDIALIVIDMKANILEFAGAYRPIIIIRNNELQTLKADKIPVGISDIENIAYANQQFNLQPNDMVYLFSDGYIDQFGGPDERRFMIKRFRNMLLEMHLESTENQYEAIKSQLSIWRLGKYEQLDDILVAGLKV